MNHKSPGQPPGILKAVAALRLGMVAAIVLPLFTVSTGIGDAAPAREPKDVFIFAGQSNMEGVDAVMPEPPGFVSTEADRRSLFTGALLTGNTDIKDSCPWGEIKGHRRTSPQSGDQLVHGPEVGFARRLDEVGIHDIAIVAVWGNFPRTVESWPWAEGGEFNRAWLAFADARLQELREKGFEPRVRGFVWHQGIDDAIHAKLSGHYQENLTALIGFLRHHFHAEKAPFILARSVNSPLARRITGAGPDKPMAQVRQAQVSVGETVPGAAWINVDDVPNIAQHHFSAESHLVIGRRFADAYLKLAGAPKTPVQK